MTGLLTTALTPRWRQYALGAALLLLGISAVLIWAAHPEILEPSAKPWSRPASWVRDHRGVGRWVLGLTLSGLTLSVAAGACLTAPLALSLLTGAGWPAGGILGRWTALHRSLELQRWKRVRGLYIKTPVAPEHRATKAAYWRQLRRFPAPERGAAQPETAPTRLGNTLKAMRERIAARHGLRLEACWYPLLTVIPEDVRKLLEDRSANVLLRTQHLLLATTSVVWVGLAWSSNVGAVPRPLLAVAYLAVVSGSVYLLQRRLFSAVEDYCDLVEAVVTTHHATLYRAVGWATPTDSDREPADGAKLNDYLLGRNQANIAFTWQ